MIKISDGIKLVVGYIVMFACFIGVLSLLKIVHESVTSMWWLGLATGWLSCIMFFSMGIGIYYTYRVAL